MTDRDKLIKLICDTPTRIMGGNMFLENISTDIADYLLANGVIVPPCKVGDTVYSLMECTCEDIDGVHTPCEYYTEIAEKMCSHPKGDCPYEYRIAECIVTDMNLLHFTKKWGKTVFLTKEEAEAELEKRGAE